MLNIGVGTGAIGEGAIKMMRFLVAPALQHWGKQMVIIRNTLRKKNENSTVHKVQLIFLIAKANCALL
jgi:hypothetical protein